MAEPNAQGRFVWYDLMTPDPGGAKAFYTAVLGWGVIPWQGPMDYDMWSAGEAPLGGVMTLPEEARAQGAPPHWLSYVQVASVDDTVARAKELGATVYVPPSDIPDTGRFAVLGDPQGAVFALYEPGNPAQDPGDLDAVGHPVWHELTAEDWTTAWDFYAALFGWEKGQTVDMGGGNLYQLFRVPGAERDTGGMFTKMPDMPVPPNWMIYVRVEDMDATLERVKEHGGRVVNGPMEVPGGDLIAHCFDPQGAAFAVTRRAAG